LYKLFEILVEHGISTDDTRFESVQAQLVALVAIVFASKRRHLVVG